MPAVVRITGDPTALAAIAEESPLDLTEADQSQRRRRQNPSTSHPDTTYNVTVSAADGDSVPQQIAEAEAFLIAHEQTLRSLLESVPLCRCSIDFSWDFPSDSVGQYHQFPATLLARLAALEIELIVSVYGVAGTEIVG